MSDAHKYRLKIGKAGEAQLDNLDKMFGKESRTFLSKLGLKKGMHVADVGCGIGNLSRWLAEQVGPTGQVYAIDNSVAQLEVAQQRATQQNINNISFHHADVNDLSHFNDQFDLTYCRWLLEHLKNPTVAVNSMAKTVRHNGILACEVGDVRTNFYYPRFTAHEMLFKRSAELLIQSGCDPDICFNIFGIFKSLTNIADIEVRLAQPLLSHSDEIKNFDQQMKVLLGSLEDSLKEKRIMTESEINQLRTELENHSVAVNSLVFLSRMTQIYGVKS